MRYYAVFYGICCLLFLACRLIEYVNIHCEIYYHVFDRDFLRVPIVQFVCV